MISVFELVQRYQSPMIIFADEEEEEAGMLFRR